jgi:hypothetical protein
MSIIVSQIKKKVFFLWTFIETQEHNNCVISEGHQFRLYGHHDDEAKTKN